jgi:hypothetical protein
VGKLPGRGRYFDALGAIGLGRARASYEGQVALEWNLAAADGAVRAYPFELGVANGLVEADLRPLVRAAVTDVVDGVTPARVPRFWTLSDSRRPGSDAAARRAAARGAVRRCFRTRPTEGVRRRLKASSGVAHGECRRDGGIALGQALVADAWSARGALSMCLAVPGRWSKSRAGELRMGRVWTSPA